MSIARFKPDRPGKYWSAVRFAQVQSEISNRARRLDYLRVELLSEPAWDILLHAYSFQLVEQQVTASELAERISVPSTTAIRWMKLLEAEGLLDRAPEISDPSQVTVTLTLKGVKMMDSYFAEAPLIGR